MSIKAIIKLAEDEIGYLEKKSNKNLDSKTANAGSGNYTKYWRDLKPSYQGEPWCNAFVNWVFYKVYGKENALRLLCCKAFDYYTPTTAGYFKAKKQWYSSPKVGDLIYFKNSTRIHHIGIVVGVDANTVTTIEGNTSTAKAVVSNGGGVWSKSYPRSHSNIAGYGRPKYSEIPSPWVVQMYNHALGRKYDATGYATWTGGLGTGTSTGWSAAKGFFLGKEYEARKRTNRQFVEDCYNALLGRASDKDGLNHWTKLLDKKKQTREQVLKGFVGSQEFANVAFKYGFDVGV